MAHTCPTCGHDCYCNGDIESVNYGEDDHCLHCESDTPYEPCDYDDEDFYNADPINKLKNEGYD